MTHVLVARLDHGTATRTVGVAWTKAPYVAFCDDDSWPAPGALCRAADLFDAHPPLALVTGRILVGPAERGGPDERGDAGQPLPRDSELPGAPLLSFLAGASVVRRASYLGVGGFEPHLFIGGEEELLATDLASTGWTMAYCDDIVVHHHAFTLRDPHERRRLGIRNVLCYTRLRRRVPGAARRTAWLLSSLPRDRCRPPVSSPPCAAPVGSPFTATQSPDTSRPASVSWIRPSAPRKPAAACRHARSPRGSTRADGRPVELGSFCTLLPAS